MHPLELVKDFTPGKTAALVAKLGGLDVVEEILRGEKEVFVGEKQPDKFFDKHGRRIPLKGYNGPIIDPHYERGFGQPDILYGDRLNRLKKHFKPKVGMSEANFWQQAEKLIGILEEDRQLSNVLKGVCLPVVLPVLKKEDDFDYWPILSSRFLPAIESSYKEQFPGRKQDSLATSDYARRISVVPASRHNLLLERMRYAEVVALFFPLALLSFSDEAALKQMESLPDHFFLTGGFDFASALIMYPDIISWGSKVFQYRMSALALVERAAGMAGVNPEGYTPTWNECNFFGFSSSIAKGADAVRPPSLIFSPPRRD
jgi:hypothetical protein